jgi:rubrerythrin
MISLSRTQAGRIHDEFKALNRAMAAKEMGHEEIFEVFFQRAYELGSVTKQEYREYRLEKLGII